MLSFDSEAFYASLAHYNAAIWPAHIAAYALSLAAVLLLFVRTAWSSALIAALLAAAWIWIGAVYHLQHFATINFMAPLLGIAFIAQGLLLAWAGVMTRHVTFGFTRGLAPAAGLVLAALAMLGYPALAWIAGHSWPQLPVLGVAPGPTVIFTFAMFLLTRGQAPVHLVIIPLLWSLIAGTAGWSLGMPLAALLPFVGLGAFALIVWSNRARA